MAKKYLSTVLLLIIGVLISSFAFYGYQVVKAPNILVGKEDQEIVIPDGATFKDVQRMFMDDKITTNIVAFSFLSKIMDYDENIRPGKYLLKENMNNIDAIRMLRAGQQVPVNITFNNIRLKDEIGEKITKNTGLSVVEFNEALEKFIDDNDEGFNKQNIIGMFIPNTYQVYFTISGDELISRMLKEYKTFWNDERKLKAKNIGLTPLEVSVLASIVQAESIKPEESPIIAGLYMNRLKKGIPLQADPTLVFAAKDFTIKRVLNIHKEIESPYNTYKYRGLPPGPINMPTIRSIDAVLNYEKHNYLYMCAREDFSGYHNFASTLREHNNNANRYQRALTIEIRKAQNN